MKTLSSMLKPVAGVALLACLGGVHASTQLNLTTTTLETTGLTPMGAPTTSGVINGGTYTRMTQQPTGTGVIDPFVRVGMQGGAGEDVVHGYNTTVNGVLNNSNEDNWNHAVRIGDMQIQTVGGSSFFRYMLDINQINSTGGSFLALDEVQIFISSAPDQSVTSFNPDGLLALGGNAKLVYRMDESGDLPPSVACNGGGANNCSPSPSYDDSSRVVLDYSLNSGSGTGDMYLDISTAAFEAAFAAAGITTTAGKNSSYMYLYSRFGSDPYNNNDGFEEWSFMGATGGGGGFPGNGNGSGNGGGNVPEPSSLLLAGLGLLAARTVGKRRKAAV